MTINTLRECIMHEMGVGIKSVSQLLMKVDSSDWGFSPAENMRTLRELVNHLTSIPEVDLAIMKEESEDNVHHLEAKYSQLETKEQLASAMEKGFAIYNDFIASLSDEDYLTKETKPFYAEFSSTQAKWHVETLTHFFHHRAQFFNYLKQLGYEVSMFDLYV